MRGARAALVFLTRLPGGALEPNDFARAPGWFAAIGLGIGALLAGVWWLAALIWPPVIVALITVALGVTLTGALHEDGLADTFDGLGAPRPAERALVIMRDSQIGTFGALALGLAVALRVTALASLGPAAPVALIAGQGLSRAAVTVILRLGPYLRAEGAGSGMIDALGAGVWPLLAASLIAAGLALWTFGTAALVGLAGLALMVVALRLWAQRRLRGVTGDILGAIQVLGDLGFLLGVVGWR